MKNKINIFYIMLIKIKVNQKKKKTIKVYSFNIQLDIIKNHKKKSKENTILINDSHENFNVHINEEIDCLVYNLGFLPDENKNLTTKASSTLTSLNCGFNKLKKGGLVTIEVYR